LQEVPYFTYLKIIGLIAIASTTFAMTYQLYYELDVCILCWWQRIFIFPIDIVILVSIWKKIRGNHIITGLLALGGTFFAGYHYYYHFI
jgi:disulfide bond formation protein DsbB